jgi:protein-tyrosine phosphatase
MGNICRSPMAEGVFRHLVDQVGFTGHIRADSAGTGAWHVGEPPHHGTQRVLRQHGIEYEHAARVVTRDDFHRFDYIIAMDNDNLYTLRSMAHGTPVRPKLLMDYASGAEGREVPDPYYNGRFDEVYHLIEQGCRGLLEYILQQERL